MEVKADMVLVLKAMVAGIAEIMVATTHVAVVAAHASRVVEGETVVTAEATKALSADGDCDGARGDGGYAAVAGGLYIANTHLLSLFFI